MIRPLVYVAEADCRDYAKAMNLPIIGCCCPACGDLSLQRQRIKQLLMDLEREHAGVKQSMLRALANVAPRHLLDTRLNPAVEVIAGHEDAAAPGSASRSVIAERGSDDEQVVARRAGASRDH